MNLCKECNLKLVEKIVLKNEELCEDCRKIIEQVVESELKTIAV